VVILGVIFFFVLFIGKRYNLFKSIYSIKRKSAGSYLLLASISLLFFISKEADNSLLFILPLLILAISDPLACIFGTWYQHKTRKIILFKREYDKTILGSSVFFISALVISITVLTFFSFTLTQIIIWSILLAALGTFIEIVSLNGTDNLTVPLVICLVLYFLSTT
jgi:phytol kinase